MKCRALLVALCAFAVVAAGCSDSSDSSASPDSSTSPGSGGSARPIVGAARTVTDADGQQVEIPVAPEQVVALDEPAALNLLAVGVTPDVVFKGWWTTVPAELMEGLGIEVRDTAGYYAPLEEVAALEPDLLVISTNPTRTDEIPEYESIAPTLYAQFDAQTDELARTWGEYFDAADRTAAISKGLTDMAVEIAAKQPAPALSLSVLEHFNDSPWYMDASNPLHGAIAAAGFTRPKLQDGDNGEGALGAGWVPFSPETLPTHDGDILAIKFSPSYDSQGVTGLPLFGSLEARAVEVDGDFWSGGAFFYTFWVLADLDAFVDGAGSPGGSADATERWDSFLSMIEG